MRLNIFDNRRYIRHLCECRLCDEWAKSGNRFVQQHQRRGKHHSEESKRKTSKSLMGHTVSEEIKKKMIETGMKKRKERLKRMKRLCMFCMCNCGKRVTKPNNKYIQGHNPMTEEIIRKISNSRKGQMTGENNPAKRPEVRKKISLSKIGIPRSEKTRRKISKSHQGMKMPEGTGEKISKSNMGHSVSEETKKKIGNANRGGTWSLSEEIKRSMVIAGKRRWSNPEYREKQLKAIFAGFELRQTKPEKRLNKLLNKLFPREYKYVGDGSILIGFKNPDFINVNGQKKIIEMFGDYWHSKERTGYSKKEHRKQRQRHFTRYGYQTLIVWECQLQKENRERLKERLIQFHKE